MSGTSVDIVVTGDSEVAAALRRGGSAVNGGLLRRALMAAALPVQSDAKRLAPVLSSTLRRSIHIEAKSDDVVAVGTDVPYARRIEYGFNQADALGRVYHQAARPYLRPALDMNRERVIRETAAAVRDQLRAAVA